MNKLVESIIDLKGAQCTSCSIAISHMARRLPGIEDVIHDKRSNTLRVAHSGDKTNIQKICEYVQRIGYEAYPRAEEKKLKN